MTLNSEQIRVEFTQCEETMLAEVFVNQLMSDLGKLKRTIENSKKNCRLVDGTYPQIYLHRKELISKYINDQSITENCVRFRLLFFHLKSYSLANLIVMTLRMAIVSLITCSELVTS